MSSSVDTLPPTPFRNLFAASGASIYVLTDDPELVRAADTASAGRYPVEAVRTWSELLDAVEREFAHIVLLDVDAVPMSFAEAMVTLNGAAPDLVVLAAAGPATAPSLMGLLSQRAIHRLIMKPADPDLVRVLVDSARARSEGLQAARLEKVELEAPTRPPRRHRPPRSSGPLWLLAVVLLTLAVAAVIVGEVYGVFQAPPSETSDEPQ